MEGEKGKWRKVYRRAIAICHPDRSPPHLRGFMESKSKELNAAWQAEDFAKVRQLAVDLGVHDVPPVSSTPPPQQEQPQTPPPRQDYAETSPPPRQDRSESTPPPPPPPPPPHQTENQNAANKSNSAKGRNLSIILLVGFGIAAFSGKEAVIGMAVMTLLLALILWGVEKVFNPSSTFKKIAIMMALLFAFIGMVASESWFLLWFGILALVLWGMRDKFKSPNAFKKTAICITIAYVLVWVAATDFRAFLGLGLLALLFFVKPPKS